MFSQLFKLSHLNKQAYIEQHCTSSQHALCHGAHTREEQEHADKDVNSNNNI